jgi:hypothetical protein
MPPPDDRGAPAEGVSGIRHSRRFSNELVEKARVIFCRRSGAEVSHEEARQMLENLTGFFTVLHEWDRDNRKRDGNG